MLCETCGLSAAITTWTDRRHRAPTTYRLCRDCAARAEETTMGQQTDETRALRTAIVRALAEAKDGLSRFEIVSILQAEADEIKRVNGVISGLINGKLATSVGSTIRLTEAGRKSLAPVAPVAAPLPAAPAPSNAAATEATREQVDRAADEQDAREALTALRAIEAAALAHAPGLPYATVAQRVISMVDGALRLASERDGALAEAAKLRADHARMVDELLATQAERDEARRRATLCDDAIAEAAGLTGRLNLANAEIARLRAQLAEAQRSRISWDIGETRRLVRQRITHETLAEVTIDGDDVVWRATDDHAHGVIAIPKPGVDDAAVEQALVMGQMLAEVACGARVVLAAKDGGAL